MKSGRMIAVVFGVGVLAVSFLSGLMGLSPEGFSEADRTRTETRLAATATVMYQRQVLPTVLAARSRAEADAVIAAQARQEKIHDTSTEAFLKVVRTLGTVVSIALSMSLLAVLGYMLYPLGRTLFVPPSRGVSNRAQVFPGGRVLFPTSSAVRGLGQEYDPDPRQGISVAAGRGRLTTSKAAAQMVAEVYPTLTIDAEVVEK